MKTKLEVVAPLSVWSNDDDLVIARDPGHASKIMQVVCGCDGTWHDGHDDGQLWERISDQRVIFVDEEGSQTAQQWVKTNGAGHLRPLWRNDEYFGSNPYPLPPLLLTHSELRQSA